MSAHTPGPWHRNVKPASKYPTIFAGRNTHVAQVVSQGIGLSEVEANCNLIAAAPELLALLIESQQSIGGNWRDRRDALISKATGAADGTR